MLSCGVGLDAVRLACCMQLSSYTEIATCGLDTFNLHCACRMANARQTESVETLP